jgi:hypothetical protein
MSRKAGKIEFAKAGGFSQKCGLAADDAAYIRVSGPALPKAGKQAANMALAPKARFVSGQGSTGAALGYGFAAPALVARAASLLPLWLPFLLLMGIFALFPAPAKAQSIDASLVGYRFECCPASGVNKQFLVLALVEHRNNVPNFNNIKYAKYQVSGDTIYLAHAKDSLTAMREGILGGKYTASSQHAIFRGQSKQNLLMVVGGKAPGGRCLPILAGWKNPLLFPWATARCSFSLCSRRICRKHK